MPAQPNNVPGAGTTERREDWTVPLLLKELVEIGSLSRRKKAFFRQDVERMLDALASYESGHIPLKAPKYVCDALDAPKGSYWIQLCCAQLDAMGVAHPDAEDDDMMDWTTGVSAVIYNLEYAYGVYCPEKEEVVPLSQAAVRTVDLWASPPQVVEE